MGQKIQRQNLITLTAAVAADDLTLGSFHTRTVGMFVMKMI
jgi:hypothetical protein